MRTSVVPLVAAALLVGLVLLLPSRDAAPPAPDLVLAQRPLDLKEPPAWAVDEATDEIERNLDRLHWVGHMALEEARSALRRHRGSLVDEVMARLRQLGDEDPIVTQKLLDVLAEEDLRAPGVLDELIRRAYSPHGIVSKAALRILAMHPEDGATAGIFPRLQDDDLDVRAHARAALAKRARRGDAEAQEIVLEELRAHAGRPDLAFLAVLDVIPAERSGPVLDAIRERADPTADFTALTIQLKVGIPGAREELEALLARGQTPTRINVLQSAVASGVVLGQELWRPTLARAGRIEALALADLLLLAVDTGHADADRAIILLEEMAGRGTGNAHMEVVDALFRREHPLGTERTRHALQVEVGGRLSQVCDRIISATRMDRSAYVELALARLPEVRDRPADHVPLLRLLAHVDPARAAEPVVDAVVEAARVDRPLATALLPLLDQLGVAGLQALAARPPSPEVDGLIVYAAGKSRSGWALPHLERVILDEATSDVLRVEALDTIARLWDGPREQSLRRVIGELRDPELTARARLLYWNYL